MSVFKINRSTPQNLALLSHSRSITQQSPFGNWTQWTVNDIEFDTNGSREEQVLVLNKLDEKTMHSCTDHWNGFICRLLKNWTVFHSLCNWDMPKTVLSSLAEAARFSFLYAFVQALWGEAGTPGSDHQLEKEVKMTLHLIRKLCHHQFSKHASF